MSGAATDESDDYMLFSTEPAITARTLSRKQRFFNLCSALVPKTQPSTVAAATIVLLSFGQFLTLVAGAKYDSVLLSIMKMMRVYPGVEAVGSSLLYIALLFLVQTLISALAFTMIIKFFCPLSPFLSYFAYMVPYIYWVGLLPISELLISIWQCDQSGKVQIILAIECRGTVHIMLMAAAGVILGLWVVTMAVFMVVVGHSQPHKQDPFAHYPWSFEVVYTLLRILHCVHERLLETDNLLVPLLGLSGLYFVSLLWHIYPYYYPKVAYSFAAGTLCVVVADISVGVYWCVELFNVSLDGLLSMTVVSCGLVAVWLYFSLGRWYKRLILEEPVESIVADAKIHVMRNILIEGTRYICAQDACLAMTKYKEDAMLAGEETLIKTPGNEEKSKDKHIEFEWNKSNERHDSAALREKSEKEAGMAVGKKRLAALVINYFINDGTNTPFMIQMSGVYLYIVGNTQMAYTMLLEAEKNEPGILMQLAIHLQKEDIFAMIETQNAKTGRRFGYSKFQKVIQFQSEFTNLRRKMLDHANSRMEFWSSIKVNPDLTQIHFLGIQMMKFSGETKKSWSILNELNPLYIPALKLYKSYAKNIRGDKEETAGLQRRIRQVAMERSWRPLTLNEIFSDNVAVIIASGDEAKIIRASRSVAQIFLYDEKELVGRSVSMLMPNTIGQQHKNFMSKTHGVSGGRQFFTFGLNRNGYIFPVRIAVQQLFSFKMGMLYVSAIQVDPNYNDDHYILTDMTGRICGVTPRLCKLLQLTTTVISERRLYLQYMCQGLSGDGINRLEGELVLKFVSTTSVVNSTPRLHGGRTSWLSKQDVMYTAKCEVTNLIYNSGLHLKAFKIDENCDSKKKRAVISTGLMHAVSTVLRALRKFKSLALRAQKKREASPTQIVPLPTPSEVLIRRLSLRKAESTSRHTSAGGSVLSGIVIAGEDRPKGPTPPETQEPLLSTTKEDGQGQPHVTGDKSDTKQSSVFLQHLIHKNSGCPERPSKFGIPGNNTPNVSTPNDTNKGKPPDHKDKKTTKSSEEARMLKGIAETRKRDEGKFVPASITYLKVATGLFVFLVLVLLSVRISVSIWLNSKIVGYAPLMSANDNRLTDMAVIAECTLILSMYYPYQGTGPVIADDSKRFSKYDYNYLMRDYEPNAAYTSYKDYIISKANKALANLKNEQVYIQGALSRYSASLVEQVNGIGINISYTMNGKNSSNIISAERVVYTVMAAGLALVDEVNVGTYNSTTDYLATAIPKNVLSNIVLGMRPTASQIVSSSVAEITLHDSFSTSAFICLLVLYAAYLVVFIPFLCFTNRDLAAMLTLLLNISRKDIVVQHERAITLIKKVHRSEKVHGKQYFAENDAALDILSINNNNEMENKLMDEHMGDATGGLGESQQASSMNLSVKAELKKARGHHHHHGKRDHSHRRAGKVREHIPYENNTIKILLLFSLFSGSVISIYFVLDYFSKTSTRTVNYKLTELKYLSRAVYANGYNMPYTYNFILSNKTGLCAVGTCASYLTGYYKTRFGELEQMLVYHKGNASLLSSAYDTFFTNIFENNACKYTSLGEITNCSSLMGGVMSAGALTTAVRVLDLARSIYNDFSKSDGSMESITEFANDERVIDLEILDLQLVEPAFVLMINYLKNSLQEDLSNSIVLTAALFSLFVAGFLAFSIGWVLWVINFTLHSIYGTKTLLSNLPDDIIIRNEAIYRHLCKNASETVPVIG